MKRLKIFLFLGDDISSYIVYHSLVKTDRYDIVGIIMDAPTSRMNLIRRRIKKLGLFHTFNQLLFQVMVCKVLRMTSRKRVQQIFETFHFDPSPIEMPIKHASINDLSNIDYVNSTAPDIIVVNGTRIISKKIIQAIQTPMINIHVGITPKYRGVHGAYWAYYNRDDENAGTTVHYIDSGIDSGKVIKQGKINKSKDDNFTTYPYLQLAKGIELLIETLDEFKEGEPTIKSHQIQESHLYSHPTIFEYFYARLFKGVK